MLSPKHNAAPFAAIVAPGLIAVAACGPTSPTATWAQGSSPSCWRSRSAPAWPSSSPRMRLKKQEDARFAVGSDVRVSPSALAQQSSVFATQLQVDGVIAATPIAQTSSAIVGTDRRPLVSIDPAGFAGVATLQDSFFPNLGASAAMKALQNFPAGALVSTEMAKTFNIPTGDRINVQLADRTGPPGARDSPRRGRRQGLPRLFPGHRPGRPAAHGDQGDRLQSRPVESNAVNLRGLGGLLAVCTALIGAAAIGIFVFGLLLQRRKEYVAMRALGIRIGQLRGLMLGEAATAAILSVLIGTLTGGVMAYMFVQMLAPLFTILPTSLIPPAGWRPR